MITLCYFTAFVLFASPLVPYDFSPAQLGVVTVALGTPLAAIGVWLNHLVEKNSKKE